LELDHEPRSVNLRGLGNTDHLLTEGPTLIRQLSDEYQKQSLPRCRFCGEHRYHQDYPIEDVAARIATIMIKKKASAENLLRTVQLDRTRPIRDH
uniref:ATP-dependent endonuclease n=1 Tax=Hymenolepis diminuta TaxID=6216 RepID=A0A0R3SX13_HYMDI